MKKRLSALALATTMAIAPAVAVTTAGVASAATEQTTGVELGNTSQLIPVRVTTDLSRSRVEGIPALQKLRAQMWDLNPYFTNEKHNSAGTRLQDVARSEGVSRSDFLNVQSDAGLVHIALQRAAENADYTLITHTRPNGLKPETATRGSQTMSGESVAAGNNSLNRAVLQSWGAKEVAPLQAARGVANDDNGHLHMLINPQNRAVGFAHVEAPKHQFKTISVAITGTHITAKDDLPKAHGSYTIYRAAGNYQRTAR